ncbi:MAG: hypothetical protein OEZ16_02765 [Chromatiales bacterium]|nr:hypothetical protein [Chromatiales bacterium]
MMSTSGKRPASHCCDGGRPVLEPLKLEAAGVEIENGLSNADARRCTSVTHTVALQGRVAAVTNLEAYAKEK